MKRRTRIFSIVLVVLHLAGFGIFFALRPQSGPAIPPDRKVDWVLPPGQFQHKCGRVCFDTEPGNRGGFKDPDGRSLHFVGAVLEVAIDWSESAPTLPFREFKASGYNVIRVPVPWSDLEPEPMNVSAETLLAVRGFLDRAAAAGIAVILQNQVPFSDIGACQLNAGGPDWAFRVPVTGDPARHGQCQDDGADANDAARTQASASIRADRFFSDFIYADWTPDGLTLQDHLIRSWTKLAEVAGRSAGLLGYQIVSTTPCPGDATAGCTRAWQEFLDRFVQGVLAVADTSVFFIGSAGMDDRGRPDETAGNRRAIAVLTEIVPSNADDYPGPYLPDVNGVFGLKHVPVIDFSGFISTVAGIEKRGRSFLVTITDRVSAARFAKDGIDPFGRLMARPRPEQVSGIAPSWTFDRLRLPDGPGQMAEGPGTTDVFSLRFQTLPLREGLRSETTVRLPVAHMYGEQDRDGSPPFTVDVSDGTVEWLPGKSDTIVWRTDDSLSEHSMKIVPWGGRRLDFMTDLADIPAR